MPDRLPAGYGVLVTRSREQAGDLIDAVRARGGEPILFPVLEIAPRDRDAVAADAARLPAPDITIFVSRNAVLHGLEFAGGRLAAIGPTTAAAIRESGADVAIVPSDGFDSESLLAEPAFDDVADCNIRIVRGEGGREVLGTELARRGARVDYLAAYSRVLPVYSPAQLAELASNWRDGKIAAIVVLSVESLANLAHLLPDGCRPTEAGPLLVTPAARVLKEVRTRFPGSNTVLAAGPRANDIVDSIAEFLADRMADTGAADSRPSTPPSRRPD